MSSSDAFFPGQLSAPGLMRLCFLQKVRILLFSSRLHVMYGAPDSLMISC